MPEDQDQQPEEQPEENDPHREVRMFIVRTLQEQIPVILAQELPQFLGQYLGEQLPPLIAPLVKEQVASTIATNQLQVMPPPMPPDNPDGMGLDQMPIPMPSPRGSMVANALANPQALDSLINVGTTLLDKWMEYKQAATLQNIDQNPIAAASLIAQRWPQVMSMFAPSPIGNEFPAMFHQILLKGIQIGAAGKGGTNPFLPQQPSLDPAGIGSQPIQPTSPTSLLPNSAANGPSGSASLSEQEVNHLEAIVSQYRQARQPSNGHRHKTDLELAQGLLS
jgi:hypothetical protein